MRRRRLAIPAAIAGFAGVAVSALVAAGCNDDSTPAYAYVDKDGYRTTEVEMNVGDPLKYGFALPAPAYYDQASAKVLSGADYASLAEPTNDYKVTVGFAKEEGVEVIPSARDLPAYVKVDYLLDVLPNTDGWSMPVVDPFNDGSLAFYVDATSDEQYVASAKLGGNYHDGDTFRYDATTSGAGRSGSLRLFSVDTAEISATLTPNGDGTCRDAGNDFTGTKGVEYLWAQRAKLFADAYLPANDSSRVQLTVTGSGNYNREAGDVKYVPKNVQTAPGAVGVSQTKWNDFAADLTRFGLAHVAFVSGSETAGLDKRNATYLNKIIELQATAMANRVGLWGEAKWKLWSRGDECAGRTAGAIFPKFLGPTTGHGLR